MSGEKILIVEDNFIELTILQSDLEKKGYLCVTAGDGVEALDKLGKDSVDLIISDQNMPGMGGLDLLQEVKNRFGDLPFIMLTREGSINAAVTSMRSGANDYLLKPHKIEDLQTIISRSISYHRLSDENTKLKAHLKGNYGLKKLITSAPNMIEVINLVHKVSSSPKVSVSIYGESGTGKEVLARAIHAEGDGLENSFVAVNCAGVPSALLESELFGHVKGAFTGADRERKGKFDLAQGGTILLDEIGDMGLDLQVKLLRVLQEKEYEPVGSNKKVKADLRIITATHRNLQHMIEEGRFREDLFHRINVFPITLPPLRERKNDIPTLVEHFLEILSNELGKPLPGISEKAMACLEQYNWPGNIRELKNCIERAAILVDHSLIQEKHLNIISQPSQNISPTPRSTPQQPGTVRFEFSILEEDLSPESIIETAKEQVLAYCDGNKSRAAKLLKRSRTFFYR
jgi:DNA-binding NtrC family response regulator